MTKFNITILLLFFFRFIFAQIGIPSIKVFKPLDYNGSTQIWTIGQDDKGLIYAGGNDGIYIYDGQEWMKYDFNGKNPVVRCLQVSNDTVWYGGVGNFGYLIPDLHKEFENHSLIGLLDSSLRYSFSSIWSLVNIEDKVLFQSDKIIFIYDISTQKLDTLLTGSFYFLSSLGNAVFISDFQQFHIYYPHSDSLVTYDMPIRVWLYKAFRYKGDTLQIFATNRMFYYDLKGKKIIKNFPYKTDIPQLYNKTLYSFLYLPDMDAIAVGTIEDGVFFIDKQGRSLQHLNKKNGLRSNSVQYLFLDKQKNIWAGHSNGISLIRTGLPFRFINETLGVEGVPYSVYQDEQSLLLGTNMGLFVKTKDGFKIVKDSLGFIPQQIFVINKLNFSDGASLYVFNSNVGLFYLAKDYTSHLISDLVSYKFLQNPSVPDELYFISDYDLYKIKYQNASFSPPQKIHSFNSHFVLTNIYENYLWFAALYDKKFGYFNLSDSTVNIIESDTNVTDIVNIGEKLFLLTDRGLFEYNQAKKKIFLSHSILNKFLKGKDVLHLKQLRQDLFVVGIKHKQAEKLYLINIYKNHLNIDSALFNVIPYISDVFYFYNNILWLINDEQFINYDLDYYCNYSPKFKPIIFKILVNYDSVVYSAPADLTQLAIDLDYKNNNLIVEYGLPSFWSDKGVVFSSWLEGRGSTQWSNWTEDNKKEFFDIREGNYTFHLKAKNEFGIETPEIEFSFSVEPPFYRSIVAYIIYGLLFLLAVYLIVKWRLRLIIKEKEHLEQLVRERTVEIQQQKEEILAQSENLKLTNQELIQKNEEINSILEQLEEANLRIQAEHKHVKDSIIYAQKIQEALIQKQKFLTEYFPEHFIIFRPKDVIGGDFYLFDKVDNYLILGVADATGHGVPGALMSMMGYTLFSQIVNRGVYSPAEILEQLRYEIINIFSSTDNNLPIYDGFDMGLCVFNMNTHKLLFSGAHLPLVIIRDGQIIELKGGKSFIGFSVYNTKFKNVEFDLNNGDKLYMFSDGYYDQFGGGKFSKFYRKRFYKLLLETASLSMEEQKNILEKTFEEWKNGYVQTDDVTVLGIKVDFSFWNK